MTTTTPKLGPRATARWETTYPRFLHLENTIHHQLVKHSVAGLRIALGLVFFGFGILKYFPGVSPAQNLTEATTHILFLGLVPGFIAIKMIATLECFIGLCLLTNRFMRLAVWLLAIEFIGILSPVVLLPGRLFAGPHHAPTLEGQYCLKDIILVAGGLVVAAGAFRGGRMVRADLPPSVRAPEQVVTEPEHRLQIVLAGINDADGGTARCARHGIGEAEFHLWRDATLVAATGALRDPAGPAPPADSADRRSAGTLVSEPGPASARRTLGPALTLLLLAVLGRRGR